MLVDTPMNIEPVAWAAWKADQVTKEVLKALRNELAEWELRLREGDTLQQGREIVETARAVGIIYGLDCTLVGIEEALRMQWETAKQEREEAASGDE